MEIFDNDELRRRVDEVLYYVWDPIGVSDAPFARGEYQGYVAEVLQLVEANDDIRPISRHLARIMSFSMELPPDKKRCNHAAEILLQHKEAIREGYA